MILSAAAAYRVFVQHTQTRRRLRVSQNASLVPETASDKFSGQGSDTAQALQEFRITRSQERSTRALCRITAHLPASNRTPVENLG